MRKVSIMPASLADVYPLPDKTRVVRELAAAREGFDRKIVVLDDDPTGVQTVHDVPVYTDWKRETLAQGLSESGALFFVLTNSRDLPARRRSGRTGKSQGTWRRPPGIPVCRFCSSVGETPPCADTIPWRRRHCGERWKLRRESVMTAKLLCPISERADV